MLSSYVHLVGSTTLATLPLSTEEANTAAPASLSGRRDLPAWSLHIENRQKLSGVVLESTPFSIPLFKAMLSCPPLPDCGQKTLLLAIWWPRAWRRPGTVMAVLSLCRPRACSSALSPHRSSFKGRLPGSSFRKPHRCYLCWPGRGAAEPRLGYLGQLHVSLVLCSAVTHLWLSC